MCHALRPVAPGRLTAYISLSIDMSAEKSCRCVLRAHNTHRTHVFCSIQVSCMYLTCQAAADNAYKPTGAPSMRVNMTVHLHCCHLSFQRGAGCPLDAMRGLCAPRAFIHAQTPSSWHSVRASRSIAYREHLRCTEVCPTTIGVCNAVGRLHASCQHERAQLQAWPVRAVQGEV